MARKRPRHVPGGTYLVVACAEHGQPIFVDDSDRVALGELVAAVIARCAAQVHAFKWLDTEMLMVMQVSAMAEWEVVRRITSVHARRVNDKSGYKGSLFRHPHRAILLEDPAALLTAVAAVNGEPVSRWSSQRAYAGREQIPWLTRETVLTLLSATRADEDTARALVLRDRAWREELRSRLRGSGAPVPPTASDQLLELLKARAVERTRPASLEQLIGAIAAWLALDPSALGSRASSPLLSLARALIVRNAMQNNIASLSELSRRFNRGRSALCEIRETYKRRVPQLFELSLAEILQGPGVAASEVSRLIERGRRRKS